MTSLAIATLGIAGLLLVLGAFALARPGPFIEMVEWFPRNKYAAGILTAVNTGWVAWMAFHTPWGGFESLKPTVYLLAPITFYLVVTYLDELLAPRMLGVLLLLVANPILAAARWHDSGWRLIVTTLMYVMIVLSVILVLSPYRFRTWMQFWSRTDGRLRLLGVLLGLAGLVLCFLALAVYQ